MTLAALSQRVKFDMGTMLWPTVAVGLSFCRGVRVLQTTTLPGRLKVDLLVVAVIIRGHIQREGKISQSVGATDDECIAGIDACQKVPSICETVVAWT